ncbi:MAG TPA: bifunctional GNAT family N-acetyltransferase/acetate--CoA ligase family protein [Gaiellales bacterium]|jgi:acyl-CoA synthetase (NDP forming)/RimJ/RimL family protein N-acetyltransferase|nr:bifunctional GNAT family N-acetyltransferase/acetate--CoA ligase family protein [Gaiellales bacterium]
MSTALERDSGVADVILRDGRTLRLRPPCREDREGLAAFLAGLSPESLHQRFHAALRPRAELVDPYLDSNWRDRGALLGAVAEDGGERIIALASYARLRDPAAAEVAFAVADAHQARGIATRMLEQLARRAAVEGIERLVFEILPGNAHMLRVVAEAGFEVVRQTAHGVVEATMLIDPTGASALRADERDHIAVTASLRAFLEPASVAVYGASARPGTIGGELFGNVLAGGFSGRVYPINRKGEAVAGVPGRESLRGVEPAVDLAVICVPAAAVLDAAADALDAGVRSLCVVSAGFAEVGAEGLALQEALVALVRSHGGRLIGPNCLGITAAGSRLNATFAAQPLPPGGVGFASQSGALGLAVVEQARTRGLGLSAFASLGNKADVSSSDFLEYWEDDEATSVVALYLESFGNPLRFGRIARRVARRKPVLALKGGATAAGARAAASHTAALASSEVAVDALFRQSGVQRARTLSEFLDAAVLLSSQPLPRGPRVAVLTNAGGLAILCADACAAEGLELPPPSAATRSALLDVLPAEAGLENPIDVLGSASAETFAAALPLLLADPAFDAVCVLFARPVVTAAADVVRAVDTAIAQAGHDKPVVGVFLSAERGLETEPPARVARFESPEAAARALGVAARRAAWLRRPEGVVPELANIDRAGARAIAADALEGVDELWLDAERSRRLLEAYGIRLAPEALAATPDEAVHAAAVIGLPVVVKSAKAGAHKTESGGVALDLRDAAAVRCAADRIGGAVLVQPMLGGAELLAGVTQDPVFGPLVAIGLGGVQAELVAAVSFAVTPLTDIDALELLAAGPVGRLAAGFRGHPPLDAGALTGLLHRLSALAHDIPELVELDLNPVLATERGYLAIDRRVRLRRTAPITRAKTW